MLYSGNCDMNQIQGCNKYALVEDSAEESEISRWPSMALHSVVKEFLKFKNQSAFNLPLRSCSTLINGGNKLNYLTILFAICYWQKWVARPIR